MEMLGNAFAIACLVFGFGFVVFFHELGHFLAAKYVGIKVEQFAVGFGHAIFAWRKGIGVRVGSTTKEFESRAKAYLREHEGDPALAGAGTEQQRIDAAGNALGLGDTEYRLNWIPLGGYVKMLGQDDLNPNANSEDPRAYNRKSIPARMLVVSAGVIMNVILAAILFMVVFLIGFKVPPPIVGAMQTNSPALLAGVQLGDEVLTLDGQKQHDFTKLTLNSALLHAGSEATLTVDRDGKQIDFKIRPQRDPFTGFLSIGTGLRPIYNLKGPDPKKVKVTSDFDLSKGVGPGDTIETVNGLPVNVEDAEIFDQQLQTSYGKPVVIGVRNDKGEQRQVQFTPRFEEFFADVPFNIAGMQPRFRVSSVLDDSPVKGILKPGDVVVQLKINNQPADHPTQDEFVSLVGDAGSKGWHVDFVVERDGKWEFLKGLVPDYKLGKGRRGVGVGPGRDDEHAFIANVIKGSAADKARIPRGALLTQINGQDIKTWHDIHRLLKSATGPVEITFVPYSEGKPADQPKTATLDLSPAERDTVASLRYSYPPTLLLAERIEPRQTSNPLTAAGWGVTETRDLLLQFYLTLGRLVQGSVGVGNLMGPIGIVHTGSIIAFRGWDWLLWFLAMISANLAVVNFLPIPIVDGGLFTFLIIEKISGKPLSPRMQTVAQLVGLAIILSVFLLVTYQDIMRLPIF